MPSADLSLQTALFARITAQLAVDGIAVAVTAHPTPDQALPFIRIGETPASSDSPAGQEFEATIDVFSRKDGPHEVKTIQQSVRLALHGRDFVADDWHYTDVRINYTTSFLDHTADVWQGVQRIRALASEVL
jgi:hypothetical protein